MAGVKRRRRRRLVMELMVAQSAGCTVCWLPEPAGALPKRVESSMISRRGRGRFQVKLARVGAL